MSNVDAKYNLMDQIGEIEEQYVFEAEYTGEEIKRLRERGMHVPDEASSDADAAHVDHGAQPEAAPKRKTSMTTWIMVGVVLITAAILLFVFLWNPNRSDVVTTTAAIEETVTEPETEMEAENPLLKLQVGDGISGDGRGGSDISILSFTELKPGDTLYTALFRQKNNENYNDPEDEDFYIVKVASVSEERIVLDHYGWYPNSSVIHRGETVTIQSASMVGAIEVLSITYLGDGVSGTENGNESKEPVKIDEEHFPDEIFREYVRENFDIDGNGTLDPDELKNVTEIDLGPDEEWQSRNVKSLKGIEFFTQLEELRCADNKLTELDISNNTKLIHLDCQNNRLTTLKVDHNEKLVFLSCYHNELSELDLSHNPALNNLMADSNDLEALDLSSNGSLRCLYCGGNNLTTLDLSHNPKLTWLDCDNNVLQELDLSQIPRLSELFCYRNQLKQLDISHTPNLTRFEVDKATVIIGDMTKYGIWEEDDERIAYHIPFE